MASFSFSKLFIIALFSVVAVATASFQFKVGGQRGWTKPTGNESETYNEWAARNRFHVGDSIYFKYKNDSVLVVNHTSYANCIVSNPMLKFEDGDTVFQFDRYGYFYFISGERGHCKAGQKLIVRVMVHPAISSPSPQPSSVSVSVSPDHDEGGWDSWWGPPPQNSTIKLTVASYFMTALGGMLVIMYLLM